MVLCRRTILFPYRDYVQVKFSSHIGKGLAFCTQGHRLFIFNMWHLAFKIISLANYQCLGEMWDFCRWGIKRKTKTKADCIALESFAGKWGVVLIQALECKATADRIQGSHSTGLGYILSFQWKSAVIPLRLLITALLSRSCAQHLINGAFVIARLPSLTDTGLPARCVLTTRLHANNELTVSLNRFTVFPKKFHRSPRLTAAILVHFNVFFFNIFLH